MNVTTDTVFLQNIKFVYQIKPLLAGGAAQLDQFLTDHSVELVVIDTLLSFVRASSSRDIMRAEYNEVNILRELATKHNTAIVVVHHLRKSGADYGLDAVAGTTGVTAAADAVWTLKKMPGGDCVLDITGREMENKSIALRLEAKPVPAADLKGLLIAAMSVRKVRKLPAPRESRSRDDVQSIP